MNLSKDIDPGPDAPRVVTAVIEIPKGSKNKYELDPETGTLRLDRVLWSSVRYPANYGLIPRSKGRDGEPLDVIVLGQEPVVPLALLNVKPIGVLFVRSDGVTEAKILAVHADDPQFRDIDGIEKLPRPVLMELENFFESYKVLEGKPGEIRGFGSAEEAQGVIREALKAYDGKPRRSARRTKKWRR